MRGAGAAGHGCVVGRVWGVHACQLLPHALVLSRRALTTVEAQWTSTRLTARALSSFIKRQISWASQYTPRLTRRSMSTSSVMCLYCVIVRGMPMRWSRT